MELSPHLIDQALLHTLSAEQLAEIVVQQQQLIQTLMQQLPSQTAAEIMDDLAGDAMFDDLLDLTELATDRTELAPGQAELANGPYLTIQSPELGTNTLSLSMGSCWTIGREADNTIVLTDQWMSRNHAILQVTEAGDYYIIDLGSRNGTFVNGRRVNIPTVLQDGDKINFGQTTLQLHLPQLPPPLPMVMGQQTTVATDVLHIRRLISVLVIDIRDFTRLTQQLDEKVLSDTVSYWFRCAGDIIRQNGSWVDKYIGDAVMAVWIHGTWDVRRDEIRRPFQALSALQRMTAQLHTRYPLPFPLRIGAGINTGYAMVGNTGSGDRPDYTALGDTVNAAFRLESSTKQLNRDVAIGPTTYRYLRQGDRQPFQSHTVQFKGYDNPLQIYACQFPDLAAIL